MLIRTAKDALGGPDFMAEGEIRLHDTLDHRFRHWRHALGAEQRRYRPVLPAAELDRLGYFDDYPQEAVAANAGLSGALILTPAACFDVYLSFQDQQLDRNHAITVDAQVFRNPSSAHTDPLPWSYSQRKYVFLGDSAFVRERLTSALSLARAFADQIGITVSQSEGPGPAADLSRDTLARQLFAADQFLIAPPGLSIAQSNNHRTHYAAKLGITLTGGAFAFAGCVGFLHDLWAEALVHRHGSIEAALRAVEHAAETEGSR